MALQWPIEKTGTTGENVKTVQYLLNSHTGGLAVDGDFGPQTKAAVQAFQGAHQLAVDGIVGNQTWPALITEVSSGGEGDAVKALQSQIDSRRATLLAIDGIFGPETDTAVRQFQTILQLAVDGVVGPVTWNAFVNGYLPGPDPNTTSQAVYQAWTRANRDEASKNATPEAVAKLFAQSWSAAAGWTFIGGNGAAGTIYYTWRRSNGGDLVVGVSDGPAGYFYADSATFS